MSPPPICQLEPDDKREKQHTFLTAITECIQSLKFAEFNWRRNLVEKAHPDTGTWLTAGPEYQLWNNNRHSAMLLIRGKPGSGKSTLARHVLELKRDEHKFVGGNPPLTADGRPGVLIADFFYSFRGGLKQRNHTLMLQSLLYQLLRQDNQLYYPLFREVYRARRSDPLFQWGYEELKAILASLATLKTQQTIYILLDAMDESAEEGRPEILKSLSKLCTTRSRCIFKCLIATRPLPPGQFDERVSHCGVITLEEKNQGDIEKVISSGLSAIKKMPDAPAVDFTFTRSYMIKHARGVFLWVALVLKELEALISAGPSQEELETLLKDLPLELEDMYCRIVQDLVKRPSPPYKDATERGIKMLTWVAFVERPLRVDEFHDAIAVSSQAVPPATANDLKTLYRAFIKARDRKLDLYIRACCGSLLEIRGPVVQLLHLTAREFLLQEDRAAAPFDLDEKRGDMMIASSCVQYLRLLASQPSPVSLVAGWPEDNYARFVERLASFPLLEYVVSSLPRHLNSAGVWPSSADQNGLERELSLLRAAWDPTSHAALRYLFDDWMRRLLGSEANGAREFYRESLLRSSWPAKFKVNCLVAAARGGYTEVVKAVVMLGAEVNGRDEKAQAGALLVAAGGGRGATVRTLVALGANISLPDARRRTALHCAAQGGHEEIARFLITTGKATIDEQDLDGETPLLCASSGGHETVMQLLLEHGANIEVADGYGRTALLHSAFQGRETATKRLLERGARPNVEDRSGRTPLSYAAAKGYQIIVVQLLTYTDRATVDAKDKSGRTPLSHAASAGHVEVANMLIRAGASIEGEDLHQQRPLTHAAMNGKEDMVRFLLKHGAVTSAEDSLGKTPLSYATSNRFRTIARLLSNSGV